jgi:hypothetical protein
MKPMRLISIALGVVALGHAATAAAETSISVPPPLLTQSFAIFRSPPEQLPKTIFDRLESGGEALPAPTGGHGVNLSLAQMATPPGNHRPLWIIPGRDWVLLYEQPRGAVFGGAEAPIALAVRQGLGFYVGVSRSRGPDRVRVMALVPDGVSTVRLGKGLNATVRNNVITKTVDRSRLWERWVLVRGD